MKEWQDPYNSFNSMKGLLYAPWYEQIKKWHDYPEVYSPPAPIEASLPTSPILTA